MYTLPSNSIYYWGIMVPPAKDQVYTGPLARVSLILKNNPSSFFNLLNVVLESTGCEVLKPSRYFCHIPSSELDYLKDDKISIPYSGKPNNLNQFIATLLKLEKRYLKYYLLKLSQHKNKTLFKKLLLIFIKGILIKFNQLNSTPCMNKEVTDLLTLHYFEGFLEIALCFNSYISDTECTETIFGFLDNNLIQQHWLNGVELSFECADYINKVKNFIETEYTVFHAGQSDTSVIDNGLSLYDNLLTFYNGCTDKTQAKLKNTIMALESFLYLILSGHTINCKNNIYKTLSNKSKCKNAAEYIRSIFYKEPHLGQDTARGAYETILSTINLEYFQFLSDEIDNIASIPRNILSELQISLDKYSGIYGANLKSLRNNGCGVLTSNAYPIYSANICNTVIANMDALYIEHAKHTILKDETELDKLRTYFREFCKTGKPTDISEAEKVRVNKGCKHKLYGFFCKEMGTEKDTINRLDMFFDATIYEYNMTTESLNSGATRSIRAFKKYYNACSVT